MKLIRWVEQAGVQISDVAMILKINRTYLYLLRRGKKNPSRKLLMRIQGLTSNLVMTKDDLLDDKNINNQKKKESKAGPKSIKCPL